jgi:alpha-tubulin suppressor-like RCC1 family protein
MESQTGVDVRASVDKTGNLAQGGNWILEEGNVNAKDLYFTDELFNYIFLLSGPNKLFFAGDRSRDLSNGWYISGTNVYQGYSGNVGIGRSNPSRKLAVGGTIRVAGNISYGSIVGDNFNLWQTSGSNVFYTGGNVGIGTSAPSAPLEISGSVMTTNLRGARNFTSSNSSIDISGNINSGISSVSTLASVSTYEHYGNAAFNQSTYSGSSAGDFSMNGGVYNQRNVGIGKTFNSEYSLDVSGDIFITNAVSSVMDMPVYYKEPVLAYDIPTNESTSFSPYITNYFAYINMNRQPVINSTGGNGNDAAAGTASAYDETVFQLPSGVSAEKLFCTSTNMFVLSSAGTLYSMGYNVHGNCGVGSTVDPIRTLTPAFTSDVCGNAITSAFRKVLLATKNAFTYYALTVSGDLYATGHNQYGQLSNGTTTNSGTNMPNLVNFSGFTRPPRGYVRDAINVGDWDGTNFPQTLGVLDNSGFVWCCGYGGRSQNGQGNQTSYSTLLKVKTSVSADLSNVTSIYGYGYDSATGFLALTTNNKLFGWGDNNANITLDGTANDLTYAKQLNASIPGTPDISRVWTCTDVQGDIFVQSTTGLIYATGFGTSMGYGSTSVNGWTQLTFFNTTTRYLVELYTSNTNNDVTRSTTFAITRNVSTDEYSLWVTGYNNVGQAGIASTDTTILTWNEVAFTSAIVRRIRRITSNTDGNPINSINGYTVILLDNGEMFYAGYDLPLYGNSTTTSRFTLIARDYDPIV